MNSGERRVALITGAASGIGRASTLALAQAGYDVVAADINEDGAAATISVVEAAGGRGIAVRTDISVHGDVVNLVNTTIETFGRLDCAHNNAGIGHKPYRIGDLPLDLWDRVISTNLTGVFYCLRQELPVMAAAGAGAIVNTSSLAGIAGWPESGGYAPAKHGIIALTKAAALEYGPSGVRVNAVCPGIIMTPMASDRLREDAIAALGDAQPLRRLGDPEDVAALVVWLCSDSSSYISGVAVPIDGGAAALR